MSKKWYLSKTLWVNTIAIVAFAVQTISGKNIVTSEYQAMILAAINTILRLTTKHELSK